MTIMVEKKKVCVVGAGVSGLAAAKCFKERGHDVTVVERSHELGGVWEPSRSYPDVQTQSPKDLYRYTGKAMPEAYPEWPKGPQVHAYLKAYAEENGVVPLIRFNTAVLGMARRADGEKGGDEGDHLAGTKGRQPAGKGGSGSPSGRSTARCAQSCA